MCVDCYQSYGLPKIVTPATRAAAALIAGVYELCAVGGNLHIAVDDWNLSDTDLKFCSEQIDRGGYDGRDSLEQLAADRACCDALMKMTLHERASALALHDGFLTEAGELTEFAAGCLDET